MHDIIRIFGDHEIEVKINNATEAQTAIQQLQIIKKQWQIEKSELSIQAKQMQLEISNKKHSIGPRAYGRGSLGKLLRAAQTFEKISINQSTTTKLDPILARKNRIAFMLLELDKMIINLKAYIDTHK